MRCPASSVIFLLFNGERVTAFLVPHKNQQPDLKDLKAYLKTHLAGFKVPKEFFIVDALPKNPAGKLLKREIKRQFTGK